jgi:hypothetical protein
VRSYNLKRIVSARAACVFVAVLATLGSAGLASGEIITANPMASGSGTSYSDTTSHTLSDIIAAGGIVIGDKLFDSFTAVTSKSVNAIASGADEIQITAVYINGDYGFKVNGLWSAPAKQLADTTLTFRASILDAYIAKGFAFKDNTLWLSAYGVSPNANSGCVSISENIYTSANLQNSIANEYVYYINDADQWTLDAKTFATRPTQIWVVKDIGAYGGIGTVGSAHISSFYQTFSQVPEPGTLALLSFTGMAMAVYGWRKRHS